MRRVARALVLVSLSSLAGCGAAPAAPANVGASFVQGSSVVRSPAALDAALGEYDRARADKATAARLAELETKIGKLAGQRDAHVSRLYWHTDLDEAVAESQRLRRPILSLRMLGRLDEELSCANSRFFRTTLYSNPDVSRLLRERFVLHWSSERPVPTVSIDYGDGRKVVRTITGNSIHYVLDSKGRPVDALPGLYAAGSFIAGLEGIEPVARASSGLENSARRERIRSHHAAALTSTDDGFRLLARRAGRADLMLPGMMAVAPSPPPFAPSAILAVNVAATKAVVERPLVRQITPEPPPAPAPSGATTPAPFYETFAWSALLPAFRATITDAPSLSLMRAKNPRSWTDGRATPVDDDGFRQLVASFETSLSIDTLKNEYGVRRELHRHFVETPVEGLPTLNRYVYGSLFLTPAEDAWLGLMPPRTFSGIADDGFVR